MNVRQPDKHGPNVLASLALVPACHRGALVSPYRRQLLRDVRTESRAIRSDLSASMLHLVDEDPRETLRRFVAGENVPVGGPFDNIEKAKEAGLAALTKAMALLNQKPGFRASRPGKA